jgi:hypothetical protein
LHGCARGIDVINEQEGFASAIVRLLHSKSAANIPLSFCCTQTYLGECWAMTDEDVSPEGNPHTLTEMSGERQSLIKLADA